MSREDFPSFPELFEAITGNEPYVWQAKAAEIVALPITLARTDVRGVDLRLGWVPVG